MLSFPLDFDGFIIGLAVGFIVYEAGSRIIPRIRRWRRKRAGIQCSVCHVTSLSPTPPRCRRPDCPCPWYGSWNGDGNSPDDASPELHDGDVLIVEPTITAK